MASGNRVKTLERIRSDRFRAGIAAAVAFGLAAIFVQHRTQRAERETPPVGRFLEIDGVRLHYVEHGTGQPVVLLHGSGGFYRDMEISGLVSRLAGKYRVIVFDRPGFGYSTRPRARLSAPEAQAALLSEALERLGIRHAVVVGHSWAALVAIALGLNHPSAVSGLVLVSGYHFPTFRSDAVLFSLLVGLPVVGHLLRFTIGPLVARPVLPAFVRRLFRPHPVPARFGQFPLWMALRPGQSRAVAAEAGRLLPSTARLSLRYCELRMPVYILAGDADRHISTAVHSERLHELVPGSVLRIVPGGGHMIHYIAPDEVARAVEEAAKGGGADCAGRRPRAYLGA